MLANYSVKMQGTGQPH